MDDPKDAELYRMITAFADRFEKHSEEDKRNFEALNSWMWFIQGGLSILGLMVLPILLYVITEFVGHK